MTLVREPDKNDNKKLSRIIKYLRGTRDLVLTLESDNTGTEKWWVDATFAVHHCMKTHTDVMMTIARGALYYALSKKN